MFLRFGSIWLNSCLIIMRKAQVHGEEFSSEYLNSYAWRLYVRILLYCIRLTPSYIHYKTPFSIFIRSKLLNYLIFPVVPQLPRSYINELLCIYTYKYPTTYVARFSLEPARLNQAPTRENCWPDQEYLYCRVNSLQFGHYHLGYAPLLEQSYQYWC